MKRKWLVLLGLGLPLLGVCALSALTVYGMLDWMRSNRVDVRLLQIATVSARVIESRNFNVNQTARLEVDTSAGDITVTAGEVDQIQVELVKTAWGEDSARAEAAAEALQVAIDETGDTLRLTFRPPDELILMSSRGGIDQVSFTIRVPAETAVTLTTGQGDISLAGTTGPANLTARFGDVTVTDLAGALTVENRNGDLTITRVRAGSEDIQLETSFGDVKVEEITARRISLISNNGDLSALGLTAGETASLETEFGDVFLEKVSADALTASTRNGKVRLDGGRITSEVEAASEFGDVTVIGTAAASYNLRSRNGSLTLRGASGPLTLDTDFGGITISEATGARLDLHSGNGKISFSGALDPASGHTVKSEFGGITLTLPAESAFDLTLETQFGRIKSDLPVTLTGELSEKRWEATLNGGGPQLAISTRNGDITLLALPDGG